MISYFKSTNNDLIAFAKEILLKLDPLSRHIFTDVEGFDMDSGRLESDARVSISLVAPTSDQSCRLRLWHSGSEDAPLEGTLGPTTIQLDPSSNSSLTIDEMTLHPVQDPGSSESYYPGIRLSQGSGMTLSSNLEEQGRFRSGDTVIFYMTFSCLMNLGGTV